LMWLSEAPPAAQQSSTSSTSQGAERIGARIVSHLRVDTGR
jgi:hypothetical protein